MLSCSLTVICNDIVQTTPRVIRGPQTWLTDLDLLDNGCYLLSYVLSLSIIVSHVIVTCNHCGEHPCGNEACVIKKYRSTGRLLFSFSLQVSPVYPGSHLLLTCLLFRIPGLLASLGSQDLLLEGSCLVSLGA